MSAGRCLLTVIDREELAERDRETTLAMRRLAHSFSTCSGQPLTNQQPLDLTSRTLRTSSATAASLFRAKLQGSDPYSYKIMVRHKKDNFSRGGKKFSGTRPPRAGGAGPRGNDSASGSSRPPFKAACWDLGHCDPKRCSGKRLMQFGLMRELSIGQRYPGVIVS